MRISKILISLVGAFSMLSILLFSCGRVAPLPGDVMATRRPVGIVSRNAAVSGDTGMGARYQVGC